MISTAHVQITAIVLVLSCELSREAVESLVGPIVAGDVLLVLASVVCVFSVAVDVCSVVDSGDVVCVASGAVVASSSAKHNKAGAHEVRTRLLCA